MARDPAAVLGELKLGQSLELDGFLVNLTHGKTKVVATVIDITPAATIFEATFHGVLIGLLEWRPGAPEPFFMEDPR